MRIARARRGNVILIGITFAVLCYALFPGRFDADSYNMWLQSAPGIAISDWQSPVLTVAMGVTREFVAGPAILFTLQLATWLFGLYLVTDALIRSGRVWTGQLISLGCAVPLVSYIFLDVNKDTALASIGMLLVGVLSRAALLGRRPSFLGYVGLFALCVLFLDLRHNAFVALAPLLCAFLYLVTPALRRSPARWIGATLAVLLALGATESWFKYRVIGAVGIHEERTLIMFDLAGVTVFSGRNSSGGLFGPNFVARATACYSPKFHDPFEWGPCKEYGQRLAELVQTKPGRDRLYGTWLSAVAAHPIAYVRHRLAYFNVLMRINCADCEDGMTAGVQWERPWRLVPKERVTPVGVMMDRMAHRLYWGELGRGVLWMLALAAAATALAGSARSAPLRRDGVLALAVVASALIYPLALLPLGVAFPQRYLHWSIMLAFVGLPLTVSCLRRRRSALPAQAYAPASIAPENAMPSREAA
jgi:hypothetical protein